ncbi:hypothetical protein OpiT1DRAFT_00310 [Opitutaceae bacterium TAV1]|nr:hypothetical protein OPIT5_26230 [Opitutaceae bacterium TAV5]EIQ01736.1 hypothetical protein OpiT1DRAFT_00310 [Opitutaceae bacterium TAV1]
MPTARRHLVIAASTLGVLLAGGALFFFASGTSAPLDSLPAATAPRPESKLSTTDRETLAFFHQTPAAPGNGQGLFETDFFKPPPAPPKPPDKPPPPKPPPPTDRQVPVAYRGMAEFPDGSRIAWLVVEDKLVQRRPGETVTGAWTLHDFDSGEARFARDDQTAKVAFNKTTTLPVPVEK